MSKDKMGVLASAVINNGFYFTEISYYMQSECKFKIRNVFPVRYVTETVLLSPEEFWAVLHARHSGDSLHSKHKGRGYLSLQIQDPFKRWIEILNFEESEI